MKTYKIMANETAADVVKGNDIKLGGRYTIEEAERVSKLHMRTGSFASVWIEEDKAPRAPRIVRSIEQDRTGVKFEVVKCDDWAI